LSSGSPASERLLNSVSTKLPALFPWRDHCALCNRNSPVIQRSVRDSGYGIAIAHIPGKAEARKFLANVFCRNVRAHALIDRGVAALCGGEGRYTQLQSQFRDNPGSLEERKGGNFFCFTGFNEEVGVGALALDPTVFSNADVLQLEANLGRLTVTRATGDTDFDGDFDQILVPGGRSFSIRTAEGKLVFDSGDDFEQITEAQVPALFNSNGTPATFDTRSDNKGPEPEGIVLGEAFRRTYAFIGLERTGGVMVFDVSNPFHPTFVQYVNTSPDDISPEGLLFIKEEDSPNGKPLLVVSHEISSTTTIFEISKD
jgi:hypothetical protein